MKKIFVAVAALATMLFVSCNKEANYPSLIQGSWNSRTVQMNITKNGKAVTAADFVAGITDAEAKQAMTEMFNELTKPTDATGASLTFKDGKVTANSTILPMGPSSGEYTVTGNTLTLKSDGQTASFTITSLTSSDLSLTLDSAKNPGFTPEGYEAILQGYGFIITVTFTRK